MDVIVGQWQRERPDLDPSAKEVTGRVIRLADLIQRRFAQTFEREGVPQGAYRVLAALRRAGEPFTLTPTELAGSLMVTSGGMTAIIDRLERQGLVARTPHPNDRRGVLVALTDEGRELADRAMEAHVATEHELLGALSDQDRTRLAALLRKLLLALDDEPPAER